MKNPKSKRKSDIHQVEATTPGDFSFNITKVAVSQICKSIGFKRSQVSALETLTLVATKYLEALAKAAASFCNAACRTQSNLIDLANALHDLSLLQGGFSGASSLFHDSSCCLLKSSVLEHLSGFVSTTYEIPFAKPIERARAIDEVKAAASSPGNLQRDGHVPEWLPGFPDLGGNEECIKKRVNGEEFWENSSSVLGCQSNGFVEKINGNDGCKLAKKRTRVKFRIKSGGKKVHLNRFIGINHFSQTEEEDAEAENEKPVIPMEAQILVYRRRKR